MDQAIDQHPVKREVPDKRRSLRNPCDNLLDMHRLTIGKPATMIMMRAPSEPHESKKGNSMAIGAAVVVCGEVVIFDEHGQRGKHIVLHGGDHLQGYTSSTVCVLHGEHVDVYSQEAKLLFKVYVPRLGIM